MTWAYDKEWEKMRKESREKFEQKIKTTKLGIGKTKTGKKIHVVINVFDEKGHALCTESLYLEVFKELTLKDVNCERCLRIAKNFERKRKEMM